MSIPLYTLRPIAGQYLRQCVTLYRLGVLDDVDALQLVSWVLQAQQTGCVPRQDRSHSCAVPPCRQQVTLRSADQQHSWSRP
jgi:hypothetical protein